MKHTTPVCLPLKTSEETEPKEAEPIARATGCRAASMVCACIAWLEKDTRQRRTMKGTAGRGATSLEPQQAAQAACRGGKTHLLPG